jgi:pyridoxine kinase
VIFLSIQSHVAYGHVGNSGAVFPLQRIGVEVWPVHTVQFSNHPGYGSYRGEVFRAGLIRDVVQGIEERGVLAECDGILSGYMGSVEIGEAIIDAVTLVKGANPAARYCCDPIIGDVEQGVFVCEGLPEFIRDVAVPNADIITPNRFELDHLTGRNDSSLSSALRAIDALHERGPGIVMVTSYDGDDTPRECMDVLVSDGSERLRLRTSKLVAAVNGAGDVIAALFTAHYLRSTSLAEAVSWATSSVHGVISRSAEMGSREMLVVDAQDEFVQPSCLFKPVRI